MGTRILKYNVSHCHIQQNGIVPPDISVDENLLHILYTFMATIFFGSLEV